MEEVTQDLQISLMRITEERDRLRTAINGIRKAIIEEGKMPNYHKAVMKRHRQEWGTLWNAIDKALEE